MFAERAADMSVIKNRAQRDKRSYRATRLTDILRV